MHFKINLLLVRPASLVSTLLLCFCLLLPQSALAEIPLIAMDGQKIVIASTVRYRTQPTLEAEVVGHVGLGAVVRAIRRTEETLLTGEVEGYWYLVEVGEQQGWISGLFLRDFKTEQKEKIWFRIMRERMDNPELSFVDRVALYRFADNIATKTAAEESDSIDYDRMSSAFALGRLLALQKAFDQVNWESAQQEPQQAWVEEHQEAERVFYDEISGQWLVPARDYWALADEYKDRAGEDEISWYAANARLGGECEGDIDCDLQREKMAYGEYLQRHPYGRYADKALQRMSNAFDYIEQALEREPDYFRHTASDEVIEALYDIVANANPKLRERAVAFKQIKAIRRMARAQ